MTPIIRQLPADKPLLAGAHNPNGKMCVMEAAAWMADEPWSDRPACVCPTIGALMRSWNDLLPNDESRGRLLKPLLPLIIDTALGKRAAITRSFMALDWLARTCAPAFLDLTPSFAAHVATLRALAPIVDLKSARAAEPSLASARDAARAARAAEPSLASARDAAWVSAWDAAEAAAGASAWDAAWAAARDAAEAAAGASAWASAWDAAEAAAGASAWAAARAAARDAARDAAEAAAGAALQPTVKAMQVSAQDLVRRMCGVKP